MALPPLIDTVSKQRHGGVLHSAFDPIHEDAGEREALDAQWHVSAEGGGVMRHGCVLNRGNPCTKHTEIFRFTKEGLTLVAKCMASNRIF